MVGILQESELTNGDSGQRNDVFDGDNHIDTSFQRLCGRIYITVTVYSEHNPGMA